MRKLALVALFVTIGCGKDPATGGGGDDSPVIDAPTVPADAYTPPSGYTKLIGRTWSIPAGSKDVYKCVRSAIANAENNYGLDPADLYVARIWADEAPTLKRWRPRAHGRVSPLLSRSSHVTVVVDERRA